jgi:hypothetical protein
MFVAWVLFPAVLLVVCFGCGLAVERAARWQLPGTCTVSLGLAAVIVLATLTTYEASTASLTTAAVVVLAGAGYVSSIGRLRKLRPEPWAIAVGLGVFAVLAAPVVLSGNATFLGYFVLNDTAVHFALIDHLLSHGRDLSSLPQSSFSAVLHTYLSTDYPVGAQVALGALRPLVGQDVAWIFQPYLAVILSLAAVMVYELLAGVVRAPALRALCAFVAAQSGLLYGFYAEASVKELAATWIITVTVVFVLATLRAQLSVRRLLPLAVVVVAAFDVLSVAIAPWLAVPLAVFAVLGVGRVREAVRRASKARLALVSGACASVLTIAVAPIIASAQTSFEVVSSVLTKQGNLGNLVAPLERWQLLGIWPSGDFRFPVTNHSALAGVLLGVALVAALLGAAWAAWRRLPGPLLLLVGNGLATAYLLTRGSPYANAKVLAIGSLTITLTAMLGAVALYDLGVRALAWALALVIGGGVVWTNALAYRGASVAPRGPMAELAAIGKRFSGQGPAFFNLSDEFAIHFLRSEALADPAYVTPQRRAGPRRRVSQQARARWDTDELSETYVESFPLLVLGRSPRNSRPPANYRLAYLGRHYEVWRRAAVPQVLAHVPLGRPVDAGAPVRCAQVMAAATRAARERARLAYVRRRPMPVFIPARARRPPGWGPVFRDPFTVIPRRPGTIAGTLHAPSSGRYEVWLQGSFALRLRVVIDGRAVGSASYQLGPPGQATAIGQRVLRAGIHRVAIALPPDNLAPGENLVDQTIGPLMLARAGDRGPLREVSPAHASSLCGRYLDWIEIVR